MSWRKRSVPETPLAGRQFRHVLAGIMDKEVLIPRLRTYLFNPKFTAITIPVRDFVQRAPDGWFHPSTHPLWPERMLYYYLSDPTRLLSEAPDINFVLAVTQGSFWHYFVQPCLLDMGLLRVVNPQAEHPWEKVEKYVSDPRLHSHGSTDGIINSDNIKPLNEDEVFEFKTMAVAKMSGCPRGAPDDPDRLGWWRV